VQASHTIKHATRRLHLRQLKKSCPAARLAVGTAAIAYEIFLIHIYS
jgi:hypothetical protein